MANQKLKTHRGAAKRFKVTGTGKVKMYKGYKSHLLTSKPPKRARRLRTATIVTPALQKSIKILLNNISN